MTLLDIEKDICRRLDKNATTLDAETKTRLDTFINDRYRELLRLDGIDLRDTSTVVQTINTPYLVLPSTITQFTSITDKDHGHRLPVLTLPALRRQMAGGDPIGIAQACAVVSESGVTSYPNSQAANALLLSSTHPNDQMTVTVEFQNAGSHSFETIAITLNGETEIPIPRSIQYVFGMQLSAPAQGFVTLREKIGGVNTSPLVQIGPDQASRATRPHQWTLLLWPRPPSGHLSTYVVDGVRPRLTLSAPADEPILPEEFHTLLVWGGCAEECLKMDDRRQQYYEDKFQNEVRRLRAFLHHSRGQRWIPHQRRHRWSDLGPGYPAE